MINPVAIGLTGQTEQKERTEFKEKRVKGREQIQMWADWTWRQQRHTSHDKSFQAFSSLFVLQATKAGCRSVGTRLPATVCATSAHSHHSVLFFVFHSAICVIPTLGSTWISGSLPTPDHYHLIVKDLFTDWYVVSNTGKLPVNGGLNGHTLCLHHPLRLHCPLTCPFQSTWGFKSRFFSSSFVFSALGPIVHVQEKALRFLIEQGPPCVYLLTTWHNRK